MIIQTWTQNCVNNMARCNVLIHNGIYHLDGKTYTKLEFESAFPKADILINANEEKKFKGENSDIEHNFIHNGKSY